LNLARFADLNTPNHRFAAQWSSVRVGPASEYVGDLPLGVASFPAHAPRSKAFRLSAPKPLNSTVAAIVDWNW
jgi:hypothetical protein